MPDESVAEAPQEEQKATAVDPLSLFPSKFRNAVEGLTYLGQLTEDVTFCGHTFGLRTLRPQHRFAIATVLQPWRSTIYEPEVYQALHVATALTHVDGKTDFCEPIGPDLEGHVRGRLNYVTNAQTGWFPPTLEFLYTRYAMLEETAAKAVRELNFLSLQNQETSSSPWQEVLSDPESSEDLMSSVIQRFMTSS